MVDTDRVPKDRPGSRGNPYPGVNVLVPDTWALDVSSHFPGMGHWTHPTREGYHLRVVPPLAEAS